MVLISYLLLPLLAVVSQCSAVAIGHGKRESAPALRVGERGWNTSLPLSNAERMKRGLTPNKPGRIYDPSRTRALLPRASDPVSNIYIEVYNSNTDALIGYTYYKTSSQDGVTSNIASADYYTLPNTGPSTRNTITAYIRSFDISGVYPGLQVNSPGNGQMPPSSVYMAAYGGATGSTTVYSVSQTYVFNIPSVPGLCTVTWLQPDLTTITPNSYYDSVNDVLYWSDTAADAGEGLTDADEVYLRWATVAV